MTAQASTMTRCERRRALISTADASDSDGARFVGSDLRGHGGAAGGDRAHLRAGSGRTPPPAATSLRAGAGEYLETIPLGRFAQPVDVANCALFLASDEAAYVTGQTIVIAGGQMLGIRGDLE